MVSRCFPGGYNVKLYISRGRLAWWLLAFLCCDSETKQFFPADCDFGEFGFDCRGTCHCAGNMTCDSVNGTCPEGCEQGYDGPTCSTAVAQKGIVLI